MNAGLAGSEADEEKDGSGVDVAVVVVDNCCAATAGINDLCMDVEVARPERPIPAPEQTTDATANLQTNVLKYPIIVWGG